MVKSYNLLCAGLLSITMCGQGYAAEPEVLATVGKITVTTADFDAAVQGLAPNLRDRVRVEPKMATQLLEGVLINRMLAEEAKKMGIDATPQVKAQVLQAADRVLATRRIEAFEGAVVIPDYVPAAKEQYELNKNKYMEPEEVRIAHILINTGGKDSNDEEAQARARKIREQALAGGDFAALAKELSEDKGSKDRGGDLGYFTRGKMVKPFEDAAFAMDKTGQISEIVKSQFGYHVLKLLDRKAARQKTFDEVKDSLIDPMRSKLVGAERAKFISKLRNDPDIKLNKEAIDRLIGRSPEPATVEAPVAK